ncbi:MAG: hypothetical protein V9G14_13090 [Cypionkella sp.]
MTETSKPADPSPQNADLGLAARFLRDTEIDTRVLGMAGAMLLIWIGFHLYGLIFKDFGAFLDPAQPVESVGANLIHRHHGHRHGAGDHRTQY